MTVGDLLTQQWHLEWRGEVYGWPLSSATFANLTGWLDLPSLRGENLPRPGRHGAVAGQKRLGERTIEVELHLAEDDDTFLPALRAATAIDENPTEEPLVIWAGTTDPELVYARIERRAIPTDRDFSMGHQRATIQWIATDPRRYSLTEQTVSVGLPATAGGGLVFPTVYPLNYGSGRSGGQMMATNTGDTSVWPTWTITGPVTGPIITNSDTGQQLLFDPTWTIQAGEVVTVNTDDRTVTLAGVSRSDRLRTRGWFPFDPGTTHVTFGSASGYDANAQLSATFRSATL